MTFDPAPSGEPTPPAPSPPDAPLTEEPFPYDQGATIDARDLHPGGGTGIDDTEPGVRGAQTGTGPPAGASEAATSVPAEAPAPPATPEARPRSYPSRPVPPPTLPDGRPAMSPTGRQWTIGHGRQLAVITEIGATLRSYDLDGSPVVDGFGSDEMSPGGRGQVLAPWPNRLGDGRYEFAGLAAHAALDEPERSNAIHGLVRWLPFKAEAHAQNVVVLRCALHPSPGYPFCLALRIEYRLGRDGLSVTTTAGNEGTVTLPLGLGFHPYLTAGTDTVDTSMLQLPAHKMLTLDGRGLPTGEVVPVEGTPFDFTLGRRVGDARMDTAFTHLTREADGRAWACLAGPAGEGGVNLWVDDRFTHLMVYTGDTLADPARRRRSLAVEPMTCGPDAFRTGRSLVVLEPGQEWEAMWGLQPR